MSRKSNSPWAGESAPQTVGDLLQQCDAHIVDVRLLVDDMLAAIGHRIDHAGNMSGPIAMAAIEMVSALVLSSYVETTKRDPHKAMELHFANIAGYFDNYRKQRGRK